MNGSKLSVRWMEPEAGRPQASPNDGQAFYLRIGVEISQRRCPACDSIVYSRRHRRCGACDHMLPESCRFTAAEAERVGALLKVEHQRHRDWLRRSAA